MLEDDGQDGPEFGSIKKTRNSNFCGRFTFVNLDLGAVTHTMTGGQGGQQTLDRAEVCNYIHGMYFAEFYRSGAEIVEYAGVPQGCEGGN